MMKTSKRMIRLQHGLQNSCDLPKPVPGIPKDGGAGGGVYADQVSRTQGQFSSHQFYARFASLNAATDMSWPNEDNQLFAASLQNRLHKTIETFHATLNAREVISQCLAMQNLQAAAKISYLEGSFVESLSLTLRCLEQYRPGDADVCDVVFQAFLLNFTAAKSAKERRSVQDSLFRNLLNFWKSQNLNMNKLEALIMESANSSLLNSFIYILFCSKPSDSSGGSSKVVDDLSPEFCLKMGHKFVASSKAGAEFRSRGSENSGSSLNQILLSFMEAENSS